MSNNADDRRVPEPGYRPGEIVPLAKQGPQPYARQPSQFQQVVPVQPAAGYGPYVPMVALKDSGIAYLLWFFLGGLGAHQFYLGRVGFGIVYASLLVLGWTTIWFFLLGLIFLIPLGILCLIDLFLIPGLVRDANARAAGVQRPF